MARTKGEKKPVESEPRLVRYRITNPSARGADGNEFEVSEGATEGEIAQAAAEAFLDGVSYGYEIVEEEDES